MPLPRLLRPAAPADWLSPLIVISKGLVTVANAAPFPYVGAAFGAGVALLELIQTVGKTSEDLKYLAESVVTIMKLLREEIDSHHSSENPTFHQVCVEFEAHLTRLSRDLEGMSKNWSSSKFRKYLNSQNVRDRIAQLTRQVDDLRANATLIAATGTRMDVASGFATVESRISELHREIKQSTASNVPTPTLELARYEEDFHALKLGDIQLQFHTARPARFVTYDQQGREKSCIGWTDYRATVKGSISTVRVYQGTDPHESWKEFLSFLADNSPSPHLPQLVGFCSSPRLRSLVFHEELCTLDEYAQTLPTAEAIVNWELRLLVAIHQLRASGHRQSLDYALVDPQNRGTMVLSHIEFPEYGSFTRHRHPPFLEWLVSQSYSYTTVPLITDCKSDAGMRDSVNSLISLRREMGYFSHLRSLRAVLTARGSVYHTYTRHPVARLLDRDAAPADMWVGQQTFVEFFPPLPFPWPARFAEAREGFTQFALPLIAKEDKWISLHDGKVQCGYFLRAGIEFGCSVPDLCDIWLTQAGSVMSHPTLHGYNPADCFVPTESLLKLTWEMVPVTDDPSLLAELPDTIHVFIRPPVLTDDNVEEPEIFWSTHADRPETNVPAATLKIRKSWRTSIITAWWEAHHYEVAEQIQEMAGFDPQTTAAAESLGLPILRPVSTGSLSNADENEPPGYPDWYGYSERDPHTMEEFVGCRPPLRDF